MRPMVLVPVLALLALSLPTSHADGALVLPVPHVGDSATYETVLFESVNGGPWTMSLVPMFVNVTGVSNVSDAFGTPRETLGESLTIQLDGPSFVLPLASELNAGRFVAYSGEIESFHGAPGTTLLWGMQGTPLPFTRVDGSLVGRVATIGIDLENGLGGVALAAGDSIVRQDLPDPVSGATVSPVTLQEVGWGTVDNASAFEVDASFGGPDVQQFWFDGASPGPSASVDDFTGPDGVHYHLTLHRLSFTAGTGSAASDASYVPPASLTSRPGAITTAWTADGPQEAMLSSMPLADAERAASTNGTVAAFRAAHPDGYLLFAQGGDDPQAATVSWTLVYAAPHDAEGITAFVTDTYVPGVGALPLAQVTESSVGIGTDLPPAADVIRPTLACMGQLRADVGWSDGPADAHSVVFGFTRGLDPICELFAMNEAGAPRLTSQGYAQSLPVALAAVAGTSNGSLVTATGNFTGEFRPTDWLPGVGGSWAWSPSLPLRP